MLRGSGVSLFNSNFMAAYLVAGELILEAHEEGDRSKIQRRMFTQLEGSSFTKLYKRTRFQIAIEERRRSLSDGSDTTL